MGERDTLLMKIAIFTDTYEPEINGIVTSIVNFSELLADAGHEVLIFCPKYKGSNKQHPHRNIRIKRYMSFSFITNKATKLSFPFLLDVIGEVKDFNPDVIHIQTPMNMGLTGLWVAKLLKIKNVQTYHTYIPDFMVYLKPKNIFGLSKVSDELRNSSIYRSLINSDFVGNFDDFKNDWLTFGKFVTAERKNKSKKEDLTTRFAWSFTRFLYNRADLVLTPSAALKTELEKNGITAPVAVQSNGIELGEFKVKTDYSLKHRILHTGRLGPEKNVDVIIRAFAHAAQKDPNLTLDIIGDGPSKKELMGLVKKLHLSNRVNFLGFVKRDKILQSLAGYDLFLTASTIETQGLVILEAMASGLPIVGVDKLAIPEVVLSGVNGFLVKPSDAGKMAEAITSLTKNNELREKMGQQSLLIVREHDIHQMVKKLEKYLSFEAAETQKEEVLVA